MPWGETLAELAAAARAADDAGFDGLWASELYRTSTVTAASMAQVTRTATVGTGIAWAFTRSPLVLAMTALDIDELSGGRFVLGLGTGVRRLVEEWHGAAFSPPVDRLRQTVDAVRAVVAGATDGAPIDAGGSLRSVRLRGWQRTYGTARTAIPIYLAAVGPKMCALAGEVADGWLGHELGSARYLREVILPRLDDGLARGGRARADLDVVVSASCVIHPDAAEARRRAAGLVAFYATVKTYRDFFAFHGFADAAASIRSAFADDDVTAMIDAVPAEMVDTLTLAGTPDEVRARLDAYAGVADAVMLSPPTHHVPAEVTREAQQAILEHFAP
jgi:probable F420-dependent oxidoreductase